MERAAQAALALAQRDKSAFTRADLVKFLGRVLPRTGMDPDAAAGLLESIADQALAGVFGQVVCLEAPEAVQPPAALVRADGRSVYQRHGGVKYATRVQLSAEEQLVAQAQADRRSRHDARAGRACTGRERHAAQRRTHARHAKYARRKHARCD